jgi:hypothetical protein
MLSLARAGIFQPQEMDRFMRHLVATLAVVGLGGCSMTLPVSGRMQDGHEIFTGSATGYMDGAGTLTISSNRGRSCSGNFVYVTNRNGEGVFTCSDGQSGPFRFVSTGTRGTGTGEIGGRMFTFTFG